MTDVTKRLTAAQAWALAAIRDGHGRSPSDLGQRMVDRPGATSKRHHKAQGLGRMGGAMMARLEKSGFVRLDSGRGSRWHPTRATLTPAGLAVLKAREPRDV